MTTSSPPPGDAPGDAPGAAPRAPAPATARARVSTGTVVALAAVVLFAGALSLSLVDLHGSRRHCTMERGVVFCVEADRDGLVYDAGGLAPSTPAAITVEGLAAQPVDVAASGSLAGVRGPSEPVRAGTRVALHATHPDGSPVTVVLRAPSR